MRQNQNIIKCKIFKIWLTHLLCRKGSLGRPEFRCAGSCGGACWRTSGARGGGADKLPDCISGPCRPTTAFTIQNSIYNCKNHIFFGWSIFFIFFIYLLNTCTSLLKSFFWPFDTWGGNPINNHDEGPKIQLLNWKLNFFRSHELSFQLKSWVVGPLWSFLESWIQTKLYCAPKRI